MSMHALARFLILVVLVSSFLLVLHPTVVEGRNLISSFKTDLIRRKSGILGSISHGHNIRLSSKYIDQKSVNTLVTPNGGGYFIKFSVGTPATEFTAIADTGSDLIWVQCSPCSHCFQQESPLFKPNKSSTYHAITCNDSKSCNQYIDFSTTTCSPNHFSNHKSCAYTAAYGTGDLITKGILSNDTLSFHLANNASQADFPSSFLMGCGYDQKGQINPVINPDGIIGLGRGTLSLVSQLGPKINYKFSYCLTPLSSKVPGKIQFGLDKPQPGAVSTPFSTNSPVYYTATLNGISTGSSSINVGLDIIIDSGTTLTYLPSDIYNSIQAAILNNIGLQPVPDPNKLFDPCYEIQASDDGFNPPDVVFHFKGADVVLKPINTFWQVGNLTCLAIVPVGNDLVILGNIAQANFEIGFDLKAQQVSFAPTNCTIY